MTKTCRIYFVLIVSEIGDILDTCLTHGVTIILTVHIGLQSTLDRAVVNSHC